mmetsp:Transcript_56798/g.161165  ORF Transcript_56798/g.161165 Transcript_56798/m.161165 type:complete len:203 (+) Transcript_56798:480-1088(+)
MRRRRRRLRRSSLRLPASSPRQHPPELRGRRRKGPRDQHRCLPRPRPRWWGIRPCRRTPRSSWTRPSPRRVSPRTVSRATPLISSTTRTRRRRRRTGARSGRSPGRLRAPLRSVSAGSTPRRSGARSSCPIARTRSTTTTWKRGAALRSLCPPSPWSRCWWAPPSSEESRNFQGSFRLRSPDPRRNEDAQKASTPDREVRRL